MNSILKPVCFISLLTIITFGAGVVILPTEVEGQVVEDLTEREDLATQRRVLKLQERIRLLYAQGKYQEVIEEANKLLEIDPTNSTAILNKELSETNISRAANDSPTNSKKLDLNQASSMSPEDIQRMVSEEGDVPASTGSADSDPFASGPESSTPTEDPGSSASSGSSTSSGEAPSFPSSEGASSPSGRFNIWLFLGSMLGLIVLVGAGVCGFVWFRTKDAPVSESKSSTSTASSSSSFYDMPTVGNQESEPTQEQPQYAAPQAEVEEEEKAEQGIHDQVTMQKEDDEEIVARADSDEETRATPTQEDILVHKSDQQVKDEEEPVIADEKSSVSLGGGDDDDSVVLAGLGGNDSDSSRKSDSVESLGIDYSDTDSSSFTDSQAYDISAGKASEQSNISEEQSAAPEEPEEKVPGDHEVTISDMDTLAGQQTEKTSEPPPSAPESMDGIDISAAAPPVQQGEKDQKEAPPTDEKSDAIALDISAPAEPAETPAAGDQPAGEQTTGGETEGGLTFNSLMFGSGDDQKESSEEEAPEEESQLDEDMSQTTFNQQFSNVMFGAGSEETKVPDAAPSNSAGDEAKLTAGKEGDEQTLVLGAVNPPPRSEEKTGEETRVLGDDKPPEEKLGETLPIAESEKKPVSMFDKQRLAGVEALNSGDFPRAVQCLSVAASLKPSDQEVRGLLEEARKKRRGVE